jgi:hypothetical protein
MGPAKSGDGARTSMAPRTRCRRRFGCAAGVARAPAARPARVAGDGRDPAASRRPPQRGCPAPPRGGGVRRAAARRARPPRGPPSYVGTVVSLSVLHRLAYEPAARSSPARWSAAKSVIGSATSEARRGSPSSRRSRSAEGSAGRQPPRQRHGSSRGRIGYRSLAGCRSDASSIRISSPTRRPPGGALG